MRLKERKQGEEKGIFVKAGKIKMERVIQVVAGDLGGFEPKASSAVNLPTNATLCIEPPLTVPEAYEYTEATRRTTK